MQLSPAFEGRNNSDVASRNFLHFCLARNRRDKENVHLKWNLRVFSFLLLQLAG
jgi:hypothetical protein